MSDSRMALSPAVAGWIAFFAFLSFFLLDLQGVATGDDLGYAFADSRLHAADGQKVEGIADIFKTQISHYQTTNGRFIIHSITQFFAALTPRWVFSLFNALVFTLLWWFSCKLILPGQRYADRRLSGMGEGMLVLVILWLSIPRPGVTMLSLKAFAINYLWTAAATVGLLLWWRNARQQDMCDHSANKSDVALMAFGAMLVGSLQESFSIPVCAGMFMEGCMERFRFGKRRWALAIGYCIGAVIEIAAPGNWIRVASSGGLFHSCSGMLQELAVSSVTVLALLLILWVFISPGEMIGWCKAHMMLLTIICVAILLAGATFTAIRQLFAPSLFAGLLIGNILLSGRLGRFIRSRTAIAGMCVILVGMLGGGWAVRQKAARQYASLIEQASSGKGILWVDASDNLYNREYSLPGCVSPMLFLSRFNDDPMEGGDLKYLYDGYTKRGFSRLYSPGGAKEAVSTILPASPQSIMVASRKAVIKGDSVIPGALDNRYAAFAVVLVEGKAHGAPVDSRGRHVSFERFKSGDSTYFVVRRESTALKFGAVRGVRAVALSKENLPGNELSDKGNQK